MTDTLTIEQAVSALAPEPVVEDKPAEVEAPAEAASSEDPEIPAGDQPADDTGAETPAEVEAEQPEPETVVEAPHFWSAEDKVAFAALTPEAQSIILRNEKAAQQTTSKKLEEAATARKAADAEREALTGLKDRITTVAEQAEVEFGNRWAGADEAFWLKLSKDDPSKYVPLRAQFDADQAVMQRVQTARQDAETKASEAWETEQAELLKTYAPELTDPVKGKENRDALAAYLTEKGASEQDLKGISAGVAGLAYKAMLYDRGVARISKPTPPAPSRPALKPSAPAATTSQQSAAQTAARRLSQTGEVDDAVALLRARRAT